MSAELIHVNRITPMANSTMTPAPTSSLPHGPRNSPKEIPRRRSSQSSASRSATGESSEYYTPDYPASRNLKKANRKSYQPSSSISNLSSSYTSIRSQSSNKGKPSKIATFGIRRSSSAWSNYPGPESPESGGVEIHRLQGSQELKGPFTAEVRSEHAKAAFQMPSRSMNHSSAVDISPVTSHSKSSEKSSSSQPGRGRSGAFQALKVSTSNLKKSLPSQLSAGALKSSSKDLSRQQPDPFKLAGKCEKPGRRPRLRSMTAVDRARADECLRKCDRLRAEAESLMLSDSASLLRFLLSKPTVAGAMRSIAMIVLDWLIYNEDLSLPVLVDHLVEDKLSKAGPSSAIQDMFRDNGIVTLLVVGFLRQEMNGHIAQFTKRTVSEALPMAVASPEAGAERVLDIIWEERFLIPYAVKRFARQLHRAMACHAMTEAESTRALVRLLFLRLYTPVLIQPQAHGALPLDPMFAKAMLECGKRLMMWSNKYDVADDKRQSWASFGEGQAKKFKRLGKWITSANPSTTRRSHSRSRSRGKGEILTDFQEESWKRRSSINPILGRSFTSSDLSESPRVCSSPYVVSPAETNFPMSPRDSAAPPSSSPARNAYQRPPPQGQPTRTESDSCMVSKLGQEQKRRTCRFPNQLMIFLWKHVTTDVGDTGKSGKKTTVLAPCNELEPEGDQDKAKLCALQYVLTQYINSYSWTQSKTSNSDVELEYEHVMAQSAISSP